MFKEAVQLLFFSHNKIDSNIAQQPYHFVVTDERGKTYSQNAATAQDALTSVCTCYRLNAAKCKVKQVS